MKTIEIKTIGVLDLDNNELLTINGGSIRTVITTFIEIVKYIANGRIVPMV
jgi:hypothetical protein